MKRYMALLIAMTACNYSFSFEIKTPSERIQDVFHNYGQEMAKRAEKQHQEVMQGIKEKREQRESEERAISPKCQFWMQQEQTERAKAKVIENCG